MTASNATSPVTGPTVTSLDRLITAARVWLEDRLPWYDRAAELEAQQRTEAIRQRSIASRKAWEQIYRERLTGTRQR